MNIPLELMPLEDKWPLSSNGPLHQLFDDKLLYEAFFQAGSVTWGVSNSVIRRALKSIARRSGAKQSNLRNRGEVEERDKELIHLIFSEPASRDRLRTLEVETETRYRRGRSGRIVKRIGANIPDLLWRLLYLGDSRKMPLVNWIRDISIERPDLGSGDYITSAQLADTAVPPEVNLNSKDFARCILLYASLLPSDEAKDLLLTAVQMGCSVLLPENQENSGDDLPPVLIDRAEGVLERPLLDSKSDSIVKKDMLAPRIEPADQQDELVTSYQPSETILQQVKDIEQRQADITSAIETKKEILNQNIFKFVSADEAEFKELMNTIHELRAAQKKYDKIFNVINNNIRRILGDSIYKLQIKSNLDEIKYENDNLEKIIINFKKANKIKYVLSYFNHKLSAFESESARLEKCESLSDLYSVLNKIEQLAVRQKRRGAAAEVFVEKVRTFIKSSQVDGELLDWLYSLNIEEMAALLQHVEPLWMPTKAFLVRLGLELFGHDFLHAVENEIFKTQDETNQRALIYFVDHASEALDKNPSIRRLIGREFFRDVVYFDTIAMLGDPPAGLLDAELVGQPISRLVREIVSHSDVLSDSDALRDLLLSNDEENNPSDAALLVFCSRKPTMTGVFYRLKDCARRMFFLPLVHMERIDASAAKTLYRDFDIEKLSDSVISEAVSGTDRIEPRHRMQLQRYLNDGHLLLKKFVTARSQRSGYETEFRKKLQTALSHLSDCSDNSPGSVPWLEYGIRGILTESIRSYDVPTLRGRDINLLDRAWEDEDAVWAQTFIDLPTFYSQHSPTDTASVALECLRLWSARKVLTKDEIALELAERGEFGAALSVNDVGEQSNEELRRKLRARLDEQVTNIRSRLLELKEKYDPSWGQAKLRVDIEDALDYGDIAEATDMVELLEIELMDLVEASEHAAEDPKIEERRSFVLRQLQLADAKGVEKNSTLHELENRWQAEVDRRENERQHIELLCDVMTGAAKNFPTLNDLRERVEQQRYKVEAWLAPQHSKDFASYLKPAADKLKIWCSSALAFSDGEQASFDQLLRWFIKFTEEQTGNLRAIDQDAIIEAQFYHVIELCDTVDAATTPHHAIAALNELGETTLSPLGIKPESSVTPNPDETTSTLAPSLRKALTNESWSEVVQICDELPVRDRDLQQIDETRTFADLMELIQKGKAVTVDQLISGARILGSVGHPISRTVPPKRALEMAGILVREASQNQTADGKNTRASSTWANIGKPPEFFRELQDGTHPACGVVEQLLRASLGFDIVNKLWDIPTKTSDPGLSRKQLLLFLHNHRLEPLINHLAAKHDPTIKGRLEQLLEVRSVAVDRPDLIGVAQKLTDQIAGSAKPTFRDFLRGLPLETQKFKPDIKLHYESDIVIRQVDESLGANFQVTIEPSGMVPVYVEATLFAEDDIVFVGGSRRKQLTDEPVYQNKEWNIDVQLGDSWRSKGTRDGFKLRLSTKALDESVIARDAEFKAIYQTSEQRSFSRIDDETLQEAYPGLQNTPVHGPNFYGRHEELEQLRNSLVVSRQPSPVLLTGMRRVGKTSLLLEFHRQYKKPNSNGIVTVYCSLAEKRSRLSSIEDTVSYVFYNTLQNAIGKKNISTQDRNFNIVNLIKNKLSNNQKASSILRDLYDEESLSDSLSLLGEKIIDWVGGGTERVVFLIDEAETLIVPYNMGGEKKIELEQFLQSLRELAQTSSKIGVVLSGSNHITTFATEYKNAFFGSCVEINLAGLSDRKDAKQILSPNKISPFLDFKPSAIDFAVTCSAGIPQFLWQIGAATAANVRSGPVTKSDIRRAISTITDDGGGKNLPFKAYDVLEPIENMLSLFSLRDQDGLWLLLWRVANVTSLIAPHARLHLILDSQLTEIDDRQAWLDRFVQLVQLNILEMPEQSTYAFRIPIFGEGFRAKQNDQKRLLHQERLLA